LLICSICLWRFLRKSLLIWRYILWLTDVTVKLKANNTLVISGVPWYLEWNALLRI
jgi:hypothetical protein